MSGRAVAFVLAVMAASISGCARAPVSQNISDPHEARNRAVHEENVALDRALVRPASTAYGTVLPAPLQQGVGNFASNLSLPSMVVNNILQGDIHGAGQNTMRFLFNTVFGIGGIFDPASEAGLFADNADFGQTLYVWGVPEGDYVVLPVIGPSTERHTIGRVVDLFTNPLSYAIDTPENRLIAISGGASRLGDRYRFSDTVDSILYESADSYTQAQLLYLQNRRFSLGAEVKDNDFDELEDLYAQ